MSRKKFDVLAIGNAVVDVLVHESDDFLTKHHMEKASMTLVSQEESESLLSSLSSLSSSTKEVCGGSAANTAVGVSSLGGKAAFVGRVKEDALGDAFIHSIHETGVFYETEKAQKGAATARCLIVVTPDAERTMQTFLGASVEIGPQDINKNWLGDTKILLLEGYLWSAAQGQEVMKMAAHHVKEAGGKVALSLSNGQLVSQNREEMLAFVQDYVDILFANEWEARALCNLYSFEEQANSLGSWCETVAWTQSEKGSLIIQGEERVKIDAFSSKGVIDMTGAGDLYAAGFLWGITKNRTLRECGTLGALAAEEVISHMGARPLVKLDGYIKNR